MSQEFTNVIVFGEPDVGKSSVIKMVTGEASYARGGLFTNNAHDVDISGTNFRLFETAGLDEVTMVNPTEALERLFTLIQSLQPNGVSLLVYVFRGKVKDSTVKNYKLFYEMLCEKQVPVVLVVTGLEFEDPMDRWWTKNQGVFTEHHMLFRGHACITAIRGSRNGRFLFEEKYRESRRKVRQLIRAHSHREPLRVDPTEWSRRAARKIWNMLVKPRPYNGWFGEMVNRLERRWRRQPNENVDDILARRFPTVR